MEKNHKTLRLELLSVILIKLPQLYIRLAQYLWCTFIFLFYLSFLCFLLVPVCSPSSAAQSIHVCKAITSIPFVTYWFSSKPMFISSLLCPLCLSHPFYLKSFCLIFCLLCFRLSVLVFLYMLPQPVFFFSFPLFIFLVLVDFWGWVDLTPSGKSKELHLVPRLVEGLCRH